MWLLEHIIALIQNKGVNILSASRYSQLIPYLFLIEIYFHSNLSRIFRFTLFY